MRNSRTSHPLAGKACGTIFGLALAATSPLQAQSVVAASDSPAVRALLAQAEQDAGTEWGTAYNFLCRADGGTANNPNDPVIEPTRLFDNLYAIGRTSTTTYALTTPDGIVLIDSGYRDDVETVLIPGLRQVGLDPSQIRYVIVAHGHADHYGGSAHLQERYGARVALSAEDWEVAAAAGRPTADRPSPVAPPSQDIVAVSGQPIVVGGTEITPILIPGHTPGALGFVFPVTDGGRRHMAGLFGGTILIHTRISDDGLRQYAESLERFGEATRRLGVDVEIQNHPMYDDMPDKLARLRTRQAGQPHPFVVGVDAYQRFLRVKSGCVSAQLARRTAR